MSFLWGVRFIIDSCDLDFDIPLDKHDQTSFISGYAFATTTGSFLYAQSYSDLYPKSTAKPSVWDAVATLLALTGYLKHDVSDVVASYAVGASCGIFIPRFHYVFDKRLILNLRPAGYGVYASPTV